MPKNRSMKISALSGKVGHHRNIQYLHYFDHYGSKNAYNHTQS